MHLKFEQGQLRRGQAVQHVLSFRRIGGELFAGPAPHQPLTNEVIRHLASALVGLALAWAEAGLAARWVTHVFRFHEFAYGS